MKRNREEVGRGIGVERPRVMKRVRRGRRHKHRGRSCSIGYILKKSMSGDIKGQRYSCPTMIYEMFQ